MFFFFLVIRAYGNANIVIITIIKMNNSPITKATASISLRIFEAQGNNHCAVAELNGKNGEIFPVAI